VTGARDRADEVWKGVGAAFPLPADASNETDDLILLSHYLRQCTQPDDRIFMQHYLPQVLALAERGFAGGHADLRPGLFTSVEMQRLTVRRLTSQSVPLALVGAGDSLGGFRESFPIVVAYFDEHYTPVAERTFGGRFEIRLLARRGIRPSGVFEPLGWPCFRPAP